jgi:DNA-binding HxlR family transcriptional regulator
MKVLPKGTFEILTALEKGPRRFYELALTRVGLKTINRRTLAERLKMLEEDGLVGRVVIDSRPPFAKYSLTERGQRLLALMKE